MATRRGLEHQVVRFERLRLRLPGFGLRAFPLAAVQRGDAGVES